MRQHAVRGYIATADTLNDEVSVTAKWDSVLEVLKPAQVFVLDLGSAEEQRLS